MTTGGARLARHRDDQQLLGLARVASAEPDLDPDNGCTCRACLSTMLIPSELEPTSLCDLCAQDAAHELGAEILRIYDVLGRLPPVVSAPIFEALKDGPARARAFISDVLQTTTHHAIGRRRGKGRK